METDMQGLIKRVESAVKEKMALQDKAHDWYHINRVRNMALRIAKSEGAGQLVVELAALVHDIGDRKAHESEEVGHKATFDLLAACNVPTELSNQVADIAHRVSFKGFGVADDMPTLEGQVVQDADRLDAIGAIAIARTFTWGGTKERPIYDPEEPIFQAATQEDYYAKGGRTSVNHFYEKLLHLKDRIHTKTARAIAERRHQVMEDYLIQFKKEWDGTD